MMRDNDWLRAARRLGLKLNFALWLDRALPLLAASAFVLAAALLWLRGRGGGVTPPWFWTGTVAVLLTLGLMQWVRARSSFYDAGDALVWLDDRLRLNNRLSAAHAGVGAWPDRTAAMPSVVRWRGRKLVPPSVFSVGVLTLAALVPVPPTLTPPSAGSEPLSWTEMERALETMRDEELVSEEALEAFEDRLDSLREQPRDEWFSHGSLEASDSLKEELAAEMRALGEGLERIEAGLGEIEAFGENVPLEERRLRGAALEESVDGIDLGRALPLHQKLSRQLKTLARERAVRALTEQELERIRSAKERLYHTLATGEEDAVLVGLIDGEGGRSVAGRPGRGGVTRGPGSAPIELSDERTELGTTGIEALRNEDVSRAGFGETVAVQVREHDVDVSRYTGGYDAGAVASFGQGGDLVWSQSLSPSERRVLRKYFK